MISVRFSAMSRRASVFARTNPGKRRVRFPDEVIFENEIKEQDGLAVMKMLRRASVDIDLNRINTAGTDRDQTKVQEIFYISSLSGLTALHQAVLDNNLAVIKILIGHGADLNLQDEDSWTPLHAACANGHYEIAE